LRETSPTLSPPRQKAISYRFLTPASLKTLRRKGFKKAMKYFSQSSSPLCVFA
jgi:hypothetical protein